MNVAWILNQVLNLLVLYTPKGWGRTIALLASSILLALFALDLHTNDDHATEGVEVKWLTLAMYGKIAGFISTYGGAAVARALAAISPQPSKPE